MGLKRGGPPNRCAALPRVDPCDVRITQAIQDWPTRVCRSLGASISKLAENAGHHGPRTADRLPAPSSGWTPRYQYAVLAHAATSGASPPPFLLVGRPKRVAVWLMTSVSCADEHGTDTGTGSVSIPDAAGTSSKQSPTRGAAGIGSATALPEISRPAIAGTDTAARSTTMTSPSPDDWRPIGNHISKHAADSPIQTAGRAWVMKLYRKSLAVQPRTNIQNRPATSPSRPSVRRRRSAAAAGRQSPQAPTPSATRP